MTEYQKLIKKVDAAINIINKYGMIDGAHHKQWVIDQVARKLLGGFDYKIWADKDWDEGIAP